MRALLRASLLLASGLARAAAAQEAAPQETGAGPADVPAGPATIRVQVAHPARPEAAAGVEVVVYALPPAGTPGLRRGTTDAAGRFAFESVSNDPGTPYLVGARFEGVPYPGDRVVFGAGELERDVEVRIADVTPDPAGFSVPEHRIRFDWMGDRLAVSESVALRNAGARTIFRPAAARAAAPAAFHTELPAGHANLTTPLGVMPEGLVVRGGGLDFFGPIYPDDVGGQQELSFAYTLPAPPGPLEVRRGPLGPARLLRVYVPAEGPAFRLPGLSPAEPVDLEGRAYLGFESRTPAAGLVVDVEVPAARDDAAAVSVPETLVFLELDDAALLVREEHRLSVSGETRVASGLERPLLQIPLPADAQELRFASESSALGLQPDPEGGLAIHGPLPPGESVIEILYRIPVRGGPVQWVRPFAKHTSLLSIYVADTGLRLASGRLHRRRPVRTTDRAHLHLEAFEIEAGETVTLELEHLPVRSGPPQALGLGVLALAAAGSVAFLLGPLWRTGPTRAAPAAPEVRSEREALYDAIQDLDHDYETGKIEEADHRSLREELRARAVALLRAERAGEAAPKLAAAGPPACAACGAASREGDRFCSHCGAALPAP
jgi:hypothetical protein